MKPLVVVFGNTSFASMAAYCLTHDSPHQVAAFTVDRAYTGSGSHEGLTIAPRTFIGAGTVVVANTEADGVYVGNPARKLGKTALGVTGG